MSPLRLFVFLSVLILSCFSVACTQTVVVLETPPPPQKQEPLKLLGWSLEASNEYVQANETTEHIVTIDVTTLEPPTKEKRRPINVSLVFDHSGSMRGPQMEDARQALLEILNQLQPDDTLSVVAFSSVVELLQPQTRWSQVDRPRLEEAIRALKAQGTTAMSPALQQALNEVSRVRNPKQINRILFLSDGQPNDPAPLPAIAKQARQSGIAITSMGLGAHHNEEILTQIADLSGGNYRFIEDSENIAAFFQAEMQAMAQVIAQNVNILLTLGPGVTLLESFGGQPNMQARKGSFFLGQMSEGETRTLTLKLQVKAPGDGALVELFDASLAWNDALLHQGTLSRIAYAEAIANDNEGEIQRSQNLSVIEKLARLQAVLMMDEAIRLFEKGQKDAATRQMNAAADIYEENNRMQMVPLPISPSKKRRPTRGSRRPNQQPSSYMRQAAQRLGSTAPASDEGLNFIKEVKSSARGSLVY